MKNIKLFTHTDLDGAGCAIVAKIAFDCDNLLIDYCDYNNINQRVLNFYIDIDPSEWEVYITDISINENVAEFIQQCLSSYKAHKVHLIDHHATSLCLNKYQWATVEVGSEERKESGASLFLNYLDITNNNINKFVELVRLYDTWEWYNKHISVVPKHLNELFYLYGRDKFIDMYVERIKSEEFIVFSKADAEMLREENVRIEKYINKKSKQMIKTEILRFRAGVVFAEQYISEIGNKLSEDNPNLDFICIVDLGNKKISYRTKNTKINLGVDVAKVFGGGGHPQSAGSSISNADMQKVIGSLFSEFKILLESL